MTLDWMRTPIRVPFAKMVQRLAIGRRPDGRGSITTLAPLYRTGDRDTVRGQDEQRRRVRELLSAIGMKADPSDNQIARTIEILGPFVPGLTIESPSSETPVPETFSVAYVAPAVGAKLKWTDERKRALLSDVDRLRRAGRAQTDKEALSLILRSMTQQGGNHVSIERLQNLLAEARRLER